MWLPMKTYPSVDEKTGLPFAFEVENSYVGPSEIARILSTIDGISDIRKRKLFGKWEEMHAWFKYKNKDFVVWEPHGDNSRYWIGPKSQEDRMDISSIHGAFERYRVPVIREIVGDLLTLRIFKRIFGKT
jgi:hypothetical protein